MSSALQGNQKRQLVQVMTFESEVTFQSLDKYIHLEQSIEFE